MAESRSVRARRRQPRADVFKRLGRVVRSAARCSGRIIAAHRASSSNDRVARISGQVIQTWTCNRISRSSGRGRGPDGRPRRLPASAFFLRMRPSIADEAQSFNCRLNPPRSRRLSPCSVVGVGEMALGRPPRAIRLNGCLSRERGGWAAEFFRRVRRRLAEGWSWFARS
jgi:hypothetical protein